MKYYSYSGKKSQSRRKANKKRLIINISIIAAVVILSVAFALVLGNHLKNKLDEAPISTEPVEDILTPESADDGDRLDFVKNDRTLDETKALFGYLDLDGCPDGASAQTYVDNLKSAGFTGVIFNAKGADGKYSFASNEAYSLARLEPSKSVTQPSVVSEALGKAKSLGMRSAAYIDICGALSVAEGEIGYGLDRAVIRELCSLGFDEIVIDGAARGEITTQIAMSIWYYISDIRAEFPEVDIGVVIDGASLSDAESAPAIEIMFRFCDFFALDFTDREIYGGEALKAAIAGSAGGISTYRTLILADGSDLAAIRGGAEVIRAAGVPRAAFITPRTDVTDYKDKLKPYSLDKEDTADND